MTRRNKLVPALCALSALVLAPIAVAGLYPRAAPPGSAFVRVFNGTNQPRPARIADQNVAATQPMSASGYVFVSPGEHPANIGGTSESVSFDANRCYTLAVAPDGVHKFDQDCFNSQLKSLLSVFNMIEGTSLSLRMPDGAKVIESVGANDSGHREVNPASATLAVYNGETKIGDAKPMTLERGKVFSLFVTGTAQDPRLTWVVN